MTIRILIADDHGMVRAAFVKYLSQVGDFEVVGEAADGLAAVSLARQLQPDLVLMDIKMPRLNGIEAARQILKIHGGPKVVILSMQTDDSSVLQALDAGVSGYILKTGNLSELEKTIRAVSRGGTYFEQAVAGGALRTLMLSNESLAAARGHLTARQREVLQLIAEGHTTKEIARSLSLSPKTVETHRSEIAARLGARGVADLVRHAVRIGLVSVDD